MTPLRAAERRPTDTDTDVRNRLIDAAEASYLQRGVSRTTVEDVASIAGVHRTTVYRYFQSKDDLLTSVILRGSREMLLQARKDLEGSGTFGDRIVAAVDGAIESVTQSRWFEVMFTADSLGMTVAGTAADEILTGMADLLTPFIEDARRRGEVRADLEPREAVEWLNRIARMMLLELAAHTPDALQGAERRDVLRRFVLPAVLP
ncbi:MAG: TetR/AcrR family transcriptional regulator [Acidimicrobiia bacterium]